MMLLMHLQVCNFLRQRGVEERVVEKFEEEKVGIWLSYTYHPSRPGSVEFEGALKLILNRCLCVVIARQNHLLVN